MKPITPKQHQCRVLASDLDGTLIPLEDDNAAKESLEQIRGQTVAGAFPLVFVTGRHLASVFDAIVMDGLPQPAWIMCDVGTSIYQANSAATHDRPTQEALVDQFIRVEDYDLALDRIAGDTDTESLRARIGELPGFRRQESFKQGRHKLSYYVAAEQVARCHQRVEEFLSEHGHPYSVISSVDPFNGDGLVDVLPKGVSKAFALDWWCKKNAYEPDEVVFCGDSGNDFAALIGGYRAVVVGNAERSLAAQVAGVHQAKGWKDRLFLADSHSTAGVLEGLRWFGLMTTENVNRHPDATKMATWGANPVGHDRTQFSVFAPAHQSLQVHLHSSLGHKSHRAVDMEPTRTGWHHVVVDDCPVGTRYQLSVGGAATDVVSDQPSQLIPDPASRFQPEGVHGPSEVVGRQFAWNHDNTTRPTRREDLIVYEMHVGAFTEAGTFAAAIERLDELVDLGITAIELMPIAECPGRWNWGYDGTHWFAPMHTLGSPDDFRRFVDEAHCRGLLVFADVVYNHFGPEGNYGSLFGDYLSKKHHTPWGAAPNFDEGDSRVFIRRFVIDNAIYWLDEFHLDGLRVDAIHCMADDSDEHITRQFGRELKQWAEQSDRQIWLIAESNVYDASMIDDFDRGGNGFDAQWCDDFAHSLFSVVRPGERLTVRDYEPGTDLATTLRRGFIFQGDVRGYRGREDSVPDERVDTSGLIYCIQNHDFIGNHPTGNRLHQLTSIETQSAAAALLLLCPAIPMVFMGEEFACANPFAFFVDFGDESLKTAVIEGRKREYPQHDWSGGVLPTDTSAYQSAKIGPAGEGNATMRSWYQLLIALRKKMIAAGVLDQKNLQVRVDVERGIYSLSYRTERQELLVVVRLTANEQIHEAIELDEVGKSVESNLLKSLPKYDSLSSGPEPFSVQANHALIWLRE